MTEKPVLLIAMPTGGQVATPTVKSLLGLTQHLQRVGIAFAFETYEFSDIVFSRNQLMSIFLTREQFSHMLFVDSDMEFKPDVVMRLLAFDAPFTAAAYPQKHPRWQAIRRLIEADAAKPLAERTSTFDLLAQAWVYNHQPGGFEGGPWTREERDGFVTIPAVGTGLMCLAREVPERMVETGAAVHLPKHETVPLHKGLRYHDFFSHRRSADGSFLYGEDQSFCHRWVVDCGGTIWMDAESVVTHWGQKGFPGRYSVQLKRGFPNVE